LARIGKHWGINPETLGNWVTRAEIDDGVRPGTTTDEAARIAELERENRELRRANEILKTASVNSTCQCNTSRSARRWGSGQVGAAGDVGRAAGAAVVDVGVGQVVQ
jgi:transposase-like protein